MVTKDEYVSKCLTVLQSGP